MMSDNWKERLKTLLKQRKLSQEKLANSIGTTRGAIGHYLSGRRIPSLSQIEAIANSLNVHPAWLLFGQQPSEIREQSVEYAREHHLDNKIQILGTITSGPEKTSHAYFSFPSPSDNTYALKVDVDNCAPRMLYGETLILEPDLDPSPGDEVIINQADFVRVYSLIDILPDKLVVCDLSEAENTMLIDPEKIVYMHVVIARISRKLSEHQKPD